MFLFILAKLFYFYQSQVLCEFFFFFFFLCPYLTGTAFKSINNIFLPTVYGSCIPIYLIFFSPHIMDHKNEKPTHQVGNRKLTLRQIRKSRSLHSIYSCADRFQCELCQSKPTCFYGLGVRDQFSPSHDKVTYQVGSRAQ